MNFVTYGLLSVGITQTDPARIKPGPADKWEYYDTIAFYRWLAVLGTIVAVGVIF